MRFILGGSDTEMNHIESILLAEGKEVIRAQKDGLRVSRGKAYTADYPTPKINDVWIECKHKDYSKEEMYSMGVDYIDHHYEGDPGYGRPPTEYWEASSIGQLYNKLSIEPTKHARMIAAGDHCLYAAYHDMCPDIPKEDFVNFRMNFFRKDKTPDQFSELKSRVIKRAKACKPIKLGNLDVIDFTPMMDKYHHWIADISCMLNMKTVTIQPHKNKEGWCKYFVTNLSRKEITYFMEELVNELGDKVITVYGDPNRQFAGAIVCRYK
jgi:hypothetical protein